MSPFCDAHIHSKILRLESAGEHCAHHVLHMLGERLIIERMGDLTDSEHMLQDVGFSIIRDINARTQLLSQIKEFTQKQRIDPRDPDLLSVKMAEPAPRGCRRYLKGKQA
jgi:hypothetical protein